MTSSYCPLTASTWRWTGKLTLGRPDPGLLHMVTGWGQCSQGQNNVWWCTGRLTPGRPDPGLLRYRYRLKGDQKGQAAYIIHRAVKRETDTTRPNTHFFAAVLTGWRATKSCRPQRTSTWRWMERSTLWCWSTAHLTMLDSSLPALRTHQGNSPAMAVSKSSVRVVSLVQLG